MKALLLKKIVSLQDDPEPLAPAELPDPVPAADQVLVRISACGVCHTELDEIEGRSPPPRFPVVPGHQVVGRVVRTGGRVKKLRAGDRVGIGWIYSACGKCEFCRAGEENLCPGFVATGRDVNGGYAEYMTVSEDFAHAIPAAFTDEQAAPLLCAGAIGYRSLRLAGMQDGKTLGLTGFGASAHLVLKMAGYRFPGARVFVFARSAKERDFAMELGAAWAGDTTDAPPAQPDCIIDTTPVWSTVIASLGNLKAGGRLVINAIRKEAHDKERLLDLNYSAHLWLEKEIKSVANVARRDIRDFLELAAAMKIAPEVQIFPLAEANRALLELKQRKIKGAKVLKIS